MPTASVVCPLCGRENSVNNVGAVVVPGQRCGRCRGPLDACAVMLPKVLHAPKSWLGDEASFAATECRCCGDKLAHHGHTRRIGLCNKCGQARINHLMAQHPAALPIEKWIELRRAGVKRPARPKLPATNYEVPPESIRAMTATVERAEKPNHAPDSSPANSAAEELLALVDRLIAGTDWTTIPPSKRVEIAAVVMR